MLQMSFKTISSTTWQQTLLGSTPADEQLCLYNAWPKYRGFSNTEQDCGKFAATMILALRSGYVKDRVILLVPRSFEAWALQQIKEHATHAITSCKKWPEQIKFISDGYLKLFSKVNLLSYLPNSEPQYWMSFGYSKDSKDLPEWLRDKLL